MASFVRALHEYLEKTIVVNVTVPDPSSGKASYTGVLKEVGDDYIVLNDPSSVGDRFVAVSVIVSFYERPEQDVSVLTEGQPATARPRAKLGPKLF